MVTVLFLRRGKCADLRLSMATSREESRSKFLEKVSTSFIVGLVQFLSVVASGDISHTLFLFSDLAELCDDATGDTSAGHKLCLVSIVLYPTKVLPMIDSGKWGKR